MGVLPRGKQLAGLALVVALLVISTAGPAEAAAPTISGLSPTSGPVGTSVTINGSNLTGATSVKFNGTSATFTVNSSSKITATVPSGATTGKITVTTPGGTATSSGSFTVTPKKHGRTVSLQLSRHLVAKGLVTATDGFSACEQSVPVKIQRRFSGRWHTVGGTLTRLDGSYRIRVSDRAGKYRARATRTALASGDICGRATSGVRRHRHNADPVPYVKRRRVTKTSRSPALT